MISEEQSISFVLIEKKYEKHKPKQRQRRRKIQ